MFEARKLTRNGAMGVEIVGLKRADLREEGVRRRLHDLWIERGLVVFRGLEGPALQIELSEVFGPCIDHPSKNPDLSKEFPQLVGVPYDPKTGDLHEVEGRKVGAWLPWHADLIYVDKINHGGILRPVMLPQSGGETGFIDKIERYETLPEGLKKRIEGLRVAYKWDMDIANQKFGGQPGAKVLRWSEARWDMQSRVDDYPKVLHPMTFAQPGTGRVVLNVSPWFATGIEGMSEAEGDDLLHEIVAHITDEGAAYYHHYEPDDMVLWDNWRMLHCGAGIPSDNRRFMQRTTIAGDYALGCLADESAVIDERIRVNV